MTTEMKEKCFRDPIKRLITWLKQRRCNHVFRGADMRPRNSDGMVEWPCSKCGKLFIEPYGLRMLEHGEITGPWGVPNDELYRK